MPTLYIIGNGFDLAHKLPTSYKPNLTKILKSMDEDLFSKITNIFFNNKIELWSDFENYIGNVESDYDLIDEISTEAENKIPSVDPLDGVDPINRPPELTASDNAVEFSDEKFNESDMQELVQNYYQKILQFIDKGLEKMINNADSRLISTRPKSIYHFTRQDYFVSFNYTHTLEKVYYLSSKNILHLHGEIPNIVYGNKQPKLTTDSDLELDDLPIDFTSDNYQAQGIPIDILNEFDPSFNNNDLSLALNDQINNEVQNDFKKKLMTHKLTKFLNGKQIDKILVIGHSLGDVDMPYFRVINKQFPDLQWIVGYYEKKEKSKFERQLNFISASKLDFVNYGKK